MDRSAATIEGPASAARGARLRGYARGNGPDVVWLWDGSSPVANWAANGVIQPLDSYIASSRYDTRNLVPAALQQVTFRGHVWGLPLIADTFWLWYNVKDFRAAGLDPVHPPLTLQQAMDDGAKLTQRTRSGRLLRLGFRPPTLGNAPVYVNGNDVNPYAGVFGASLYSPDGTRATPDSPANLAAWTEMRREASVLDGLYGHDALVRFLSGLGAPFTAQDAFLTDRVSMKIDGDWVPQNVRDYKSSWKYGVDYAVAPIPYPAGYARFANRQPIATYPMVVSSRSKHPAEAWELIRWLQEPAQVAGMAAYLYNLPQYKVALESPALTALPGFNQLLPLLNTRITLVSDPIGPVSDQYYTILNSYAGAIIGGRTTPQAAMAAVRQRVQPLLTAQLAKAH